MTPITPPLSAPDRLPAPMRVHPGSVLLVAKADHPEALALARKISAWLEARGVANSVIENRYGLDHCLPAGEPALVVVLGGDGTMISVARKICAENIALLGINFARVGFLTNCSSSSWRPMLEAILEQGTSVSPRLLLDVRVLRGSETLLSTVVVNDIVVGRGNLARLIHLELHIEGEKIASLRADGLILSTPTGSSAYSYSAGGPLIHPELNAVGLTPICSFLTEFKPLVLPADRLVSIVITDDAPEAYLTMDGQSGFRLRPGDRVEAVASSRRMLLADIAGKSYFQKLKDKGFIEEA